MSQLKPTPTHVGSRLRAARVERNMSQGDLAAQTGVSRQLISFWELGHGLPGRRRAAVAAALGLSPESLEREIVTQIRDQILAKGDCGHQICALALQVVGLPDIRNETCLEYCDRYLQERPA